MKRSRVILLLAIFLAGAFVVYVALRNPQPPLLPRDENHPAGGPTEPCMDCHAKDGVYPRSENHPLGNDCFRCHGRS